MVVATSTIADELVGPIADEIRGKAAQAEAERRLPADLFQSLMDAGLFSIYTPKQFGGLELPLPDALHVVEEVSQHDGSVGWTVALGLANGRFTAGLAETVAGRILGKGSVLITSAAAFAVRAVSVAGGYRLTGRWAFNSGAPNAHWIGAAVPIFDGETQRMGEHGPQMIFAFLPPSDVQIIDTWHVTGLRASGTQDLYVEDVFVPEEMTGEFALPAGPTAVRECLLANIPFFSFLGVTQSPPVCLGLARRAIEEFGQLALVKEGMFGAPKLSEQTQAQVGLARAEALVRSARAYWYENVQVIWDAASRGQQPSLEDLVSMRLASLTATENCVAATDLLYRLAGSTAIFQSSPLERCWRDVHTAAQHMQVQDGRWETAGRVLFGLDAASPIL